jgi:gas vesicle protein
MNRNSWSAMITGITIGLGVGAALGILFAPQSGEDTRDYLMGAAKDRFNQTKDHFGDVGDRIRDVSDRFSDAVESGKDFARQAQKSVDHVKGHLQDLADAGQKAYRDARNS